MEHSIFIKQIGTGLDFSNLIVDGKSATLARSNVFQGQYDDSNKVFTFKRNDFISSGGSSEIIKNDVLVCLEERWAGCIGVSEEINYKSSAISSRCVYSISLKEESSKVFFENSRVYKDEKPYFFLANNLILLDQVNEFYYDSNSGYLYYYPSDKNAINSSSFIIPEIETILDTTGLVDRVTFNNFVFNGSNFTYPLNRYLLLCACIQHHRVLCRSYLLRVL